MLLHLGGAGGLGEGHAATPVQTACFRAETLQPPLSARIEGLAIYSQGLGANSTSANSNSTGNDSLTKSSTTSSSGSSSSSNKDRIDIDAVPLEKITIFIGTADGMLLVYESRPKTSSSTDVVTSSSGASSDLNSASVSLRMRVSLKRFNPSKKPVSQLQFVEKFGLLFSIHDGDLVAHQFGGDPLLQVVAPGPSETITLELGTADIFSSSRTVLCYAVDTESDFICVAFKRLLAVLHYKVNRDSSARRPSGGATAASSPTSPNPNGGAITGSAAPGARGRSPPGKFRVVYHIPMTETVRSLQWTGPDQVCVGFAKDYAFFNLRTGAENKRPRMRTGGRKQPLMCNVRSSSAQLLSIDKPTGASTQTNPGSGGGAWQEPGAFAEMAGANSAGELLLCKDNQGFFVGFDGQPSRTSRSSRSNEGAPFGSTSASSNSWNGRVKPSTSLDSGECVSWTEVPSAVIACQPFMVGLLHRKIEIHLATTCRRVQVLTLPGCTHVAKTTERLSSAPQNSGKDLQTRRTAVFMASEKYVHVLLLRTLPEMLDILLDQALDENYLGCALEIFDAAEMAAWDQGSSHSGSGENLMVYPGAGVTQQGLRLLQAKARAHAALYYFRDCAPRHDFKHAAQLLNGAKATGRLPFDFVALLFMRTELFDAPEAAVTTSLNLADLRTELGELYHAYLHAMRITATKASREASSAEPSSRTSTPPPVSLASAPILALDYEPEYVVQSSIIEATDDLSFLRGAVFARAILTVFLPYALQYRQQLLSMQATVNQLLEEQEKNEGRRLESIDGIIQETLCIVDDLILRGLVLSDASSGSSTMTTSTTEATEMRAMVAHVRDQKTQFLRGQNWCSVDQCEQLLLQYPESWETLLWLYFGKGLHENALSWLHKLEQNEGRVLSQVQATGRKAPRKARAASSPFVARSIEYLRRLGAEHEKVILEYCGWIIDACIVQDSLAIFQPPPNVSALSVSKVTDRLEELDERARTEAEENGEAFQNPISIAYLEYVIDSTGDMTSNAHNKLGLLYMKQAEYLQAKSFPLAQKTMDKLLRFLETSTHYNPSELALCLKPTTLHAAYAIVLSRLNRHKEALRIYVDELNSISKAEAYCSRVYSSGSSGCGDVFNLLVQAMVSSGRVDEALRLTERHPREIDASKVLQIMPGDLPLAKLHSLLKATFRYQESRYRDSQVVKQLLKKEEVSARQSLSLLRRRYSVITQFSTCANPKCGRHFLDGQAVARLPSGKVVHYACLKDLGIDPESLQT